jgi:sugar lactone lactonase YvrE
VGISASPIGKVLTGLLITVTTMAGLIALAPAAHADIDSHRGVVSEQPVERGIQVADGEVRSVAQVGNRIVLGGTFTQVGPGIAGAAGPVDITTHHFTSGFPTIDGPVYAVVTDGGGGWYLGGNFTSIGGVPRRNLGHVTAAGIADTFAPEPDGPVRTLQVTSDALYLGGEFTAIAGTPAARVARVNRLTGSLVWAGNANSTITSTALSSDGSRLYVGGDFTILNGASVKRLGVVSTATGLTDPTFASLGTNQTVRALAVVGGSLWLGGDFTTVAGTSRTFLAAVDATSGALGIQNPAANGAVYALTSSSTGATVYAGGVFSTVSAVRRPRLVALDAVSGAVGALTLPTVASGGIRALNMDGDSGIYVGGDLVLSPQRSQPAIIARVDVTSGTATAVVSSPELPAAATRPAANGLRTVLALGRDTSRLLVGGDFSDYGLATRTRLAAYDLTTGALDRGFDPAPNGDVMTVKGSADGTSVYVGGQFSSLGGASRSNLAKLSLTTGLADTTFTANTNSYVKDLAVRPDGTTVYAGGEFSQVNGVAAEKLTAVDAATGTVRSDFAMPLTNPTNDNSEGGARALALSPDGRRLMVIGNFRTVAGMDRPLIAQINVAGSPATVADWRTSLYDQPCARGRIGWMRDVDISPDGTTAYVASSGHFYYPACDTANAFPITVTGTDIRPTWSTKIGDTIEAVAATGGAVYLGGHFRYIETETQTQSRFQLAALNSATGTGLNWDPNANGYRGVIALESEPAGLLIGSDGDLVGQIPHGRTAVFAGSDPGIDLRKTTLTPWLVAPGGSVNFDIAITNTFTDRSLTVTGLTDARLGNLAGVGSCVLPQTIAAGGRYSCAVTDTTTGVALASIRSAATVTATDGTTTATDSDTSTVGFLAAGPTLRIRTTGAPASLQYPGGPVAFGMTLMNLDLTRPLTVTSLTSASYGDLSTRCGLPLTLAPNTLGTCPLSFDVTGPVGSRPSPSFTATGTIAGSTVTSSAAPFTLINPPAAGTEVVLVVADPAALTTPDTKLRDRLDIDHTVTVADDTTVTGSTAPTASAIIIAPSTNGTALTTRLRDTPIPVVVMKNSALDELGMTGATSADQGKISSGTTVELTQPMHPLAASYSGIVTVLKQAKAEPWGHPTGAAQTVARVGANQEAIFAYRPGSVMASGTAAPACRIAYLTDNSAVTQWSATGQALFDRAIGYADTGCGRGMLWTAAGNGTASYPGDGGWSTAAGLSQPYGVAFDASGNAYVTDASLHAIRRISPAGVITTVAGTGTAGFAGDGGPATAAQLNTPVRTAVTADGTLYVADSGNHRIRKISPTGTISTVVGTGTAGFAGDGGPATAARLNRPFDVAVDSAGTLFIADQANNRVRKVTSAGTISTVAGNGGVGYSGDGGPAISARLDTPYSVALSPSGTMYIADLNNERIRAVDTAGTISTIAGTGEASNAGDGGLAIEAGLHKPNHVLIAATGDIYICEQNNNKVRHIAPDGVIDTLAGTTGFGYTGDGGPAIFSTWYRPSASALDAAGNLWVVDRLNRRIRVINAS